METSIEDVSEITAQTLPLLVFRLLVGRDGLELCKIFRLNDRVRLVVDREIDQTTRLQKDPFSDPNTVPSIGLAELS